ncbi:hypothetical protein GCM10027037_22980 [Mucilaginibacter koreensis]
MAYSTRSRFPFVFAFILIILFGGMLYLYIRHQQAKKPIIAEDVMVQKITSMGKLELVKYSMKDVIEKRQPHTLLPDERVLLVAVGEVAACIDLAKVTPKDIISGDSTVTVRLPRAEICYFKLDHDKSKVYDVSGTFFSEHTKNMVEDTYKIAEKRLLDNATQMNILGKAQSNAQLIFKPLLENISGKKVVLEFK